MSLPLRPRSWQVSRIATDDRTESVQRSSDALRLVIVDHGDSAARRVPLVSEAKIIGLSDGCVVAVEHASVSRRHAAVRAVAGAAVVKDLGSCNHTTVRGRVLGEGDEAVVNAGESDEDTAPGVVVPPSTAAEPTRCRRGGLDQGEAHRQSRERALCPTD
jgi:hypothetical protein